ncbi:hypothetical protein [Herbiconiux daphne]|uniref:Uncharacterized protein n=1 Tax=Herbiconiux daphne TaxID=2970914 RepID=A0ABT2H407_9MICO|nr:hypothetical protein [Herbiconiux daphne]MCS5734660.1 hypothetical protein [Herbiconiux daphne]
MQPQRAEHKSARGSVPVLTPWGDVAADALDYELIWLGYDPARTALGRFADAHATSAPVWRLVSGYLMLAARTDAAADPALGVFSHGHQVGQITAHAAGFVLRFDDDVQFDGVVVRSDAGIAVVADDTTRLSLSPDRRTVTGGPAAHSDAAHDDAAPRPVAPDLAAADTVWGITVVHGPAAVKIDNRLRLLRTLQQVGGRRA